MLCAMTQSRNQLKNLNLLRVTFIADSLKSMPLFPMRPTGYPSMCLACAKALLSAMNHMKST